METYRQHWDALNPLHPRRRRGPETAVGAFATDAMMMPREELIRTPYFNEFLAPFELSNLLAIKLAGDARDDVQLNLFRSSRSGAFDEEQLALARRLGPHLHGAARIAGRLPWAGFVAEGTGLALDLLGNGTVLLDGAGRVIHLNAAAERMLAAPDGLAISHGRLVAGLSGETATLARLIGRAATGRAGERFSGAASISRPSGRRAWAVVVAPVTTEIGWLAPLLPAAIVSIADPELVPAPPSEWLAQLYGFTGREAAVALGIAAGGELKEVAENLGLTVLSARQYLSRALRKSGARRQHDLTRLLITLGMAPG